MKTIERHMKEYSIPCRCDVYSTITDAELVHKNVSSIIIFFPRCGHKSVDGRLKSEGVLVSRKRIQESLRRVDPVVVNLVSDMFFIVEHIQFHHPIISGTSMDTINQFDGVLWYMEA